MSAPHRPGNAVMTATLFLGNGDDLGSWYGAQSAAHHIEAQHALFRWPAWRLSKAAVDELLAIIAGPDCGNPSVEWARLTLVVSLVTGRRMGDFRVAFAREDQPADVFIAAPEGVLTLLAARPSLVQGAGSNYVACRLSWPQPHPSYGRSALISPTWAHRDAEVPTRSCTGVPWERAALETLRPVDLPPPSAPERVPAFPGVAVAFERTAVARVSMRWVLLRVRWPTCSCRVRPRSGSAGPRCRRGGAPDMRSVE